MRRGEVRLVEFEPARGAEANKIRPAVIVSNDGATRSGRGVITVLPLTSNIARIYRFQVLLPAGECGLSLDSKVQAEQVRSVGGRADREVAGHDPGEPDGRGRRGASPASGALITTRAT